eukprot:TRINITY_DN4532_c5_g3_i1.p1 TRINITY_DN4532_c5_g3~~TRINITY_DN4532_c5_g3_i1.p1  ORF type:complete len:577 (+),score=188.37 TRINITY_DN4532_c5_g3_i1:76-1731(+)
MPSPVRCACRTLPPTAIHDAADHRRSLSTADRRGFGKRVRVCRLLSEVPPDIIAEVLEHLPPSDLLSAEATCVCFAAVTRRHLTWRHAYRAQVVAEDWRTPLDAPACWKRFYYQVRKERDLIVAAKIPASSAKIVWRVPLPLSAEPARRRSREFVFSADALGQPIKWQIEVELARGTPVPEHCEDSVDLLNLSGVRQPHRQVGLVRMWTTNQWTSDATRHYYGSHCTISLRDPLSLRNVWTEQGVDIDNSQALEFNSCCMSQTRELVVAVHLTLALERPSPLNPFYRLISDVSSGESDAVRIGYCKAVFEVARCKRKAGGIFVKESDRDIAGLVQLAGAAGTSDALRVEVFQALFNLLGPTSLLLSGRSVADLLTACFRCLRTTPVPAPASPSQAALLAQNALGAVFNLLVHPLSKRIGSDEDLRTVARLLDDSAYAMCHFSVLTVLLTVSARGRLPADMRGRLLAEVEAFMVANDPIDSDCTGVAWDDSDVAAFFVPLLRSGRPLCVRFASWCIAKYYFPKQAAAVQQPRRAGDCVDDDVFPHHLHTTIA